MTPPVPTTHTRDEDFEAEVRAMLARRSADVSPTTSTRPGEAGIRAVAPSTADRRHAPHRQRLAAAAAAVLVVGVATFAVTRDRSPSVETSAGSGQPADPIIWPLGDQMRGWEMGEAADMAGLYLSDVVTGPDRPEVSATVSTPTVEGATATVPYTLGDAAGEVSLRRTGDGWGVTSATSDAVRIDVASLDGETVEVGVELGSDVETETVLRASSVGADGSVTPTEFTTVILVDTGEGVVLEPTTSPETTLVLSPDDPDGRSIALDVPAGLSPVAVRVDLLEPDDGDPSTAQRVLGHASAPVDGPASPSPTTPAPDDLGAAGRPDHGTAPTAPDLPATPSAPADGMVVERVEGTFRGEEEYEPTGGTCPSLDHALVSTFELTDGTTWDFEARYCGRIEGDTWSGEGVFTFRTPDGATLTGTFTSTASVTSDGEPYDLDITGGTGRYAGATGTCSLDNHLLDVAPGAQEQSGTFSCAITVPAAG